MGYCMRQEDATFRIDREHKHAAFVALKGYVPDWNGHHLDAATNLVEAFRELRWEVEEDADGNIVDIQFSGEKHWDADKVLALVAPFVSTGSFIEMSGDDDTRWRWVFEDGSLRENHAERVWPDDDEQFGYLSR